MTKPVVVATRIGHGLISIVFIGCMLLIYLGAWRGRVDTPTYIAGAVLLGEGALLLLNKGDCPLGPVFERLGDETPFFELFLPRRPAKLAIPFFTAVTLLGGVFLAARTL